MVFCMAVSYLCPWRATWALPGLTGKQPHAKKTNALLLGEGTKGSFASLIKGVTTRKERKRKEELSIGRKSREEVKKKNSY